MFSFGLPSRLGCLVDDCVTWILLPNTRTTVDAHCIHGFFLRQHCSCGMYYVYARWELLAFEAHTACLWLLNFNDVLLFMWTDHCADCIFFALFLWSLIQYESTCWWMIEIGKRISLDLNASREWPCGWPIAHINSSTIYIDYRRQYII